MSTARVIHLADFSPEHPGSFAPFVEAVMAGVSGEGWDGELVLPAEAEERPWFDSLAGAGIDVRLCPAGGRRMTASWLRELLDGDRRPTLLHTHFTRFDLPAAIAARRLSNVQVWWHVHTVLPGSPRGIAANILKFAVLAQGVERILCPAANIADGITRRGLGRAPEVEVFPSAIDTRQFPLLGAERRAEARRRLNFEPSERVLVHFGRDWRVKGGDIFLGAVEVLRSETEHPLVAVTLRGGAAAEAEAARLDLGASLRVIDFIEDITDLYAVADVLVAPSRGEGMPFAVVEALSCGTSVVASDLPGHKLLGDRLAACAIAEREPSAFAREIRAMLERDKATKESDSRQAHEWVASELELSSAATRLVAEYRQAFARDHPA